MKRTFIFALSFLFAFPGLKAQCDLACYHFDPGAEERSHNADITHMKVEVRFEVTAPQGAQVLGKVTHQFTPLRPQIDTLFFDGPGITIKSALLNNKPIDYRMDPKGVTVFFKEPLNWNQSYELILDYEARPRKGLYFIGWNQEEPEGKPDLFKVRKQIWTQGQGIDNRHWIPMYDNMNDKYTTETIIHFDEKYKVLSNGALISKKKQKNGTLTWHYKMDKPHAGYLLMLAIGDYEIKSTKTTRGTPVHFWYYPEFKDRVELTSLYTEKMITFLEDETGYPYPWGSYSQVMVQDFLYGAMENTTATIFGDFFFVNERAFEDRNYINVNAHELTHQWFGDLITARASNDIWLQENFATFYAKWFFGILDEYGMDEVKLNQLGEFNSAHQAALKDNLPVRHSQSGTARAYPKGSSVLQMLRYVIGDEPFKKAVQHYLEKHEFGNVQGPDFQNAFKDRLGYNLDWFFEQWINKGGEPHYEVSYNTLQNNDILITVKQIHKQDQVIKAFKMPINMAVYFEDGSVVREQKWINTNYEQVILSNPKKQRVKFVVFDENYEILKKLTFVRTASELNAQAIEARNMADQLEALKALDTFPMEQKRLTLERIMTNNKVFYAVKSEAWRQWLNAQPMSSELPAVNLPSQHKAVRLTLATHLNAVVPEQRTLLIELLSDNSYQVIETALDNLFKNQALLSEDKYYENATSWLEKVKDLDGMNKAIRIKYLEYQFVLLFYYPEKMQFEDSILNELIDLAGPGYEFRTRVNAFQTIKRINMANHRTFEHLFEAMSRPNSRLAGPARAALNHFNEQSYYKPIIYKTFLLQPEYIRKHANFNPK